MSGSAHGAAHRVPRPESAGGFSLLEVLLALIIVAMIMAAIGPALIGALHAQRQARLALAPLAAEQAAFAVLRDDLLTAPRPNGTLCQPLTVVAGSVNGLRADTLQITCNGASPIHPRIAVRPAALGQAVVTWSAQPSADQNGLSWTRSAQGQLLATGTPPTPVPEIMLDHLAQITVEALAAGAFAESYSSDDLNQVLPMAVRISFSYIQDDGTPGPLHVLVLDLPQVELDPTQQSGGT